MQTTLASFITTKYNADPGSGHRITENKDLGNMRFCLQNPDGILNKDKRLDDRQTYLALREWQADVIALPETNKNWELEWLRNKWRGEVTRVWCHANVYTASIKNPSDKYGQHLQGGVGLIITNR